jgi:hypothetical protein
MEFSLVFLKEGALPACLSSGFPVHPNTLKRPTRSRGNEHARYTLRILCGLFRVIEKQAICLSQNFL